TLFFSIVFGALLCVTLAVGLMPAAQADPGNTLENPAATTNVPYHRGGRSIFKKKRSTPTTAIPAEQDIHIPGEQSSSSALVDESGSKPSTARPKATSMTDYERRKAQFPKGHLGQP
ncbi:MAG: hypothetical protein KC474_04900, partial [Cyanobacteria bacterium HKST-UBA04]|nr:hypothetical protein [Cyanobacteria bacterium HKST-UBA04]